VNRIIALAGRAGSGKSTVGQWLVEHRGAVEVSFAAPLKRLAMEVFGFSERQVFGTQQDKETTVGDVRVAFGEEVKAELAHAWSSGRAVSPREMLIRLGDGARRHIAPDVWIRAALRQIDELPDGTLAVVTDVRYGNEAQAIYEVGKKARAVGYLDAGTAVIRLNCPDAATTVDRNASSERSVDEIESRWLAADLTVERSPGAVKLIETFAETFSEIEKGWSRDE